MDEECIEKINGYPRWQSSPHKHVISQTDRTFQSAILCSYNYVYNSKMEIAKLCKTVGCSLEACPQMKFRLRVHYFARKVNIITPRRKRSGSSSHTHGKGAERWSEYCILLVYWIGSRASSFWGTDLIVLFILLFRVAHELCDLWNRWHYAMIHITEQGVDLVKSLLLSYGQICNLRW